MTWDWSKIGEKNKESHKKAMRDTFSKKKFSWKYIVKYYERFIDRLIIDRKWSWKSIVSLVVIYVAVFLTFWMIARWINYKFSYEKLVEKKIIEMIDPEVLKEKYRR